MFLAGNAETNLSILGIYEIDNKFVTNTNINLNIPLTFKAIEANSIIKLKANGDINISSIFYRYGDNENNNEWKLYTLNTPITLSNINDKVQFKNTSNEFSKDENNYINFEITGKIEASGNIQSLLNYNSSCTKYCFINIFKNCSGLISAPELLATTLDDYCYQNAFENTSISSLLLPATILKYNCYTNIVNNCTNLSSISININEYNIFET